MSIDALAVRQRLGRKWWLAPEPFGPDGWKYASRKTIPGHSVPAQSVIISAYDLPNDPTRWVHASIANTGGPVPTYQDLVTLHQAVWPNGYAYQAFVPAGSHVNIHPYALHLWGRLDGLALMPDVGAILGSI